MNISLCVCAWFLSLVFCAPWCCLFFIEVTPGKGAAILVISSCIPLLKVNLFLGFPLQCFHCRIQFHVIKVVHETPFRFSRPIMNKYSKCFRTWEWFVNILLQTVVALSRTKVVFASYVDYSRSPIYLGVALLFYQSYYSNSFILSLSSRRLWASWSFHAMCS